MDVAVVGGGIAGVLTAYELAKGGARVALLEKGTIGSGETGYTTGFLTQVIDLPIAELSQRLGAEGAKQVWQAGAWAIQRLEELSTEVNVACEFLPCSAYILASDTAAETLLRAEVERARELGFTARWQVKSDGHATPEEPLACARHGYLSLANQGKFHPRKFLTAMAGAITTLGGLVAEKTNIKQLKPGSPHQLITPQGTILAKQVVICTNLPRLLPELLPHLTPFQTYALEAHLPPQFLPEALYWDTSHPYTYFRVDRFPDHDRLILGGGDHPADQPPPAQPHLALRQFIENLWPGIPAPVLAEWGGQVVETADGLPLIGAVDTHSTLFVAAGFSGSGMTYGAISAAINSQLIQTGQHPWSGLFTPQRFPFRFTR